MTVPAVTRQAEAAIRDLAASLGSLCSTRRHHPTYGVTKASIQSASDRLDGAIGLYMVLTGQAAHPLGVLALCRFAEPTTGPAVDAARAKWREVR